MAINFNNFSEKTSFNPTDKLVGFDNINPGGEKKWSYSNLVDALEDDLGPGATGGGTDKIFFENDQVMTTSYTIPSGKNAMSAGPIAINNGVVLTVSNGSTYTVV
jgi:hypothetical protein